MSVKEKEAEIWCPACHTLYAQLFRVQISHDVWAHETDPADVPSRCSRCQTILERR